MKQKESTELSGYSFDHIYHKNDPTMTKQCLNNFPNDFPMNLGIPMSTPAPAHPLEILKNVILFINKSLEVKADFAAPRAYL